MSHRPTPARSRPERGVALIEVMTGMAVLLVALLAHVSSVLNEDRMAREQVTRSEALQVVRQLVESLRADEDWAGLYGRLRVLRDAAQVAVTGQVRLDDGRGAYDPTVYDPDFQVPEDGPSVAVLVDVPASTPVGGGALVLREDAELPEFGLPSDLNGDGHVHTDARDADYTTLPIVVTFRWQAPGQPAEQMRLATWLRGTR
jgi:hypothetical protein